VQQLIGPNDVAHAEGWIRFGGAGFVISTVQMNAYLLLLPQWSSAVYLVLALLGFGAWNSPAGQRGGITAAGYLAAFAIVGQPFNQYWGSMLAPLLALGAGHGAVTLFRLYHAATQSRDALASQSIERAEFAA
jgi:hypothetical protein